jgi:hypothetical protein
MMTTDTGGPGPDFGSGGTFIDVFDNLITSAQKAFSQYNAQASAPPPGAAAAAIGQNIVTPVAVVAGVVLLIWLLR